MINTFFPISSHWRKMKALMYCNPPIAEQFKLWVLRVLCDHHINKDYWNIIIVTFAVSKTCNNATFSELIIENDDETM